MQLYNDCIKTLVLLYHSVGRMHAPLLIAWRYFLNKLKIKCLQEANHYVHIGLYYTHEYTLLSDWLLFHLSQETNITDYITNFFNTNIMNSSLECPARGLSAVRLPSPAPVTPITPASLVTVSAGLPSPLPPLNSIAYFAYYLDRNTYKKTPLFVLSR